MAQDRNMSVRLNIMVSEDLDNCLTESAKNLGLSKSAFIRQAVERECALTQDELLAAAAEKLAHVYKTDEELTALTALDAEDFA